MPIASRGRSRLVDAVLDLALLLLAHRLPTSIVTVPSFGFGMRPRGPEHLSQSDRPRPSCPASRSRDRTRASPRSGSSCGQVLAAHVVGAGLLGLLLLVALGEDQDARIALPVPWGRTIAPRTIWSACFGSTPRLMASSTLSSNFASAGPLLDGVDTASSQPVEAWSRSTGLGVAVACSACCISTRHGLALHFDAHGAGRAQR